MKKTILTILSLLISLNVYSADNRQINRYAILVGANDGGDERAILRYAETDAKMMAKVFSDIGGINTDSSILLLNPTKSSLLDSFNTIKEYISSADENTRTELIFYYSGHSDEDGLLIRDSHLYYRDLKNAIKKTNADVKIGILDSCSSGAFTKLKGGRHSAPFLVDESIETEGHAFITSAAEDEAAQESNRLQASFFTHYLVSALRGAADTSLDGKVSLHEAYSYASRETLARTETTQAGAQHASYDFRLTGAGDLVLTDLRDAESTLTLIEDDFGRFFIRDENDNLISEVNKKYGTILNISVPASTYTIIKEVDGLYSKQILDIGKGQTKKIYPKNYISFTPESNVVRGNRTNQIEYEFNVPETTAIFGWSTMDKVRNAKLQISLFAKAGSLDGFQLSLANMVVNDVKGAQVSLFANMNGGDLSGFQLTGLYNITGGHIENYGVQLSTLFNYISHGSDGFLFQGSGLFNYIGQDTEGATIQTSSLFNAIEGNAHAITFQLSGLFNSSEKLSGLQTAALFNSSENLKGVQVSGLFNSSATLYGAQLTGLFNSSDIANGLQIAAGMNFSDDLRGGQVSGIFNYANNVYGLQISLINVADYVYGTQIGLININKDIKGLPIGLINISTEGIKNISYRYTTNRNHYVDYQFGSSIFYHILSLGLPNDITDIDEINIAAGLGFHIPVGNLYAEADLSLNNKLFYKETATFKYKSSNPVMNIKLGIPLGGDFALIGGISLNFPDVYRTKETTEGTEYEKAYDDECLLGAYDFTKMEHNFFIGLRF